MQPIVECRSGKLRGQSLPGGILSFQGIPFARPPIGDLRFRPPQPPQPWAGTREATATGPSAPQPTSGTPIVRITGLLQRRIDEDCLYLNLWTPGLNASRRPVLVWIHGGAFLIGSGSSFVYRGHRLARRGDVVIVTLNYRLGALGFLDLSSFGAADSSANCGLRDQIAALEWVRDNVAAFGGDPDNVTVFGQSAGAMSIGALLGVPRARGLLRRVILQSGAAHNVATPTQAAERAERFLKAAGLGGQRVDGDLVATLREMKVEHIVDAQGQALGGSPPRASRLPFAPSVDGDLIPVSPLQTVREGGARSVEILIGTTREEWKLFAPGSPRRRRMDGAELERRAARLLLRGGLVGVDAGEAVAAYRDAHPSAFDTWIAMRGDEIFRLPAIRLAEAQARHQPVTFAYLFDFPPPAMPRLLGSCHGLELLFVFGTLRHPALRPLFLGSRRARRLSESIQDAWLAFARDGSPSHDGLGEWPAYEESRRVTMRLAAECGPQEAPDDQPRRFWDGRM